MKTFILIFSLVVVGGVSLGAQTNSYSQVPDKAIQVLGLKYPQASGIVWTSIDGDRIRARFHLQPNDYRRVDAIFTSRGYWLETRNPIELSQLPDPVIHAGNIAHRGYKVAYAREIDTGSQAQLFELSLRKKHKKDIKVRMNTKGQLVTRVPTRR